MRKSECPAVGKFCKKNVKDHFAKEWPSNIHAMTHESEQYDMPEECYSICERCDEIVIEKVTKPKEWLHQMSVHEKPNGGIRIRLDPRALNAVLKR